MNLHITYFTSIFRRGDKVSYNLSRKLGFLFGFFFLAMGLNGQALLERTVECSCIDNNAPTGQAQFEELLTVSSLAGETWYITSVSGFYQLGSQVPPIAQIPFTIGPAGDTLLADGAGNYTLSGLLIENLGYSISLTNEIDTVTLSNILCEFPSAELNPDNAICNGEVVTYSIENPNIDFSYSWDVSGQAEIIGSSITSELVVDWSDNGVGTEQIYLYVTGPTGCSSTQIYNVEFEEDITLACNDNLNHAVASNCIIQLLPDDVLEDMKYNDASYEITITDPVTGAIIPQGTLASDVLFDTLEYSIEHLCSGNSCWGQIVFEDKYVPPLTCLNDTVRCDMDDSPYSTGFPLPSTAFIYQTGQFDFLVENFDPCGDATLSYIDSEVSYNCSFDYISVVTREWTLTDFSGYTTGCTQLIYKTRTTLEDINFPGDWDGITNPVLACDGNYPLLPSGYPDPIYTGTPSGGICDHINVSYTDLISVICGATYKVVRKWKVYDECMDRDTFYNQLIKIEDPDAPEFFCPSTQNYYIENTNECSTTVITPFPNIIYDCSTYELNAEIVKVDQFNNIIGLITDMDQVFNGFRSYDRELGRHRVTYYAIDECGNESQCSFFINVYDNVPPTAICDQSTTISLDNEGTALVPVSTFDNGSFDNCSVASVEISRGPNDCNSNYGYSDHISLCCADAGTDVMVTLRVTDQTGNINTCMVMVTVQDKKAPSMVCPANVSINCDDDYSDLSQYGSPTVTDNCSFIIDEEVNYQLNVCGIGTIYRKFIVIDDGGNESFCTQIINVVNGNGLDESDITWPLDYTTTQCITPELEPEDLPGIYSFPEIDNLTCSEIGINHYDQVFTNVNGSCRTIFRTWSVKDNCTFTTINHTQKLYITDDTNPEFDECSDKTLTGQAVDNCEYSISYSKTASDQCTASDDLQYEYFIDLFVNGTTEINNFGNSFNLNLPAGTHKVTWYVKDQCNNQKTCVELITIEDTKKPSPYCIGGISTVIMPATGTIGIWASDFNLDSEDNCTSKLLLEYSFSPDKNDTGMTFTCEDLEGQSEKVMELEIYVHDQAGNYDYCTATIRLNANNACDTINTGTISFDGNILTDDGEIMKDVELKLIDKTQQIEYNIMSDELGHYAFHDLPMLMDYSITANYQDDPLNGITTFDIILIQKHILGIATLDSPYKVFAADVNSSESISGADIVQIRKLILGKIVEFDNSPSWKFVDGNQVFINDLNPWPVNESIEMYGDASYSNQNLISVKMGDVNYSRGMSLLSEADTRNTLTIEYELDETSSGYNASFELPDAKSLLGMQLHMNSPMFSALNYLEAGQLDIDNNMIFSDNNSCALSWSRAFAQNTEGNLFTLNFGHTSPTNLLINNEIMKAEAYVQTDNGVEAYNVNLRQKTDQKASKLIIHQNIPNPFNDQTQIDFELPKTDLVTLEIRNVEGLLLYTKSSIFQSGLNQFQVSAEELNINGNSGVLIYTIHTSQESVSMKMVTIQ